MDYISNLNINEVDYPIRDDSAMRSCGKFRETSLTSCYKIGCFGVSETLMNAMTDKPSDYLVGSATIINYEGVYDSYTGTNFIHQVLINAETLNVWNRVMYLRNDVVTVYKEWSRLALGSEVSDLSKIAFKQGGKFTGTRYIDCTKMGAFGVSATTADAITDKPDDIAGGSTTIINFENVFDSYSGTNIVWQVLVHQNLSIWSRLLLVRNGETSILKDWAVICGNIYAPKKIYAFGDSRTWYDGNAYGANTLTPGETCAGYLSWIRKMTGAEVINMGYSGYTTSQIYTKILETEITNADVILFAGGINDFVFSATVGEIKPIGSEFDTSTTYGATQAAVEHFLTNYPTVKLYMTNPFMGWTGNGNTPYPTEYAEVRRKVAELYSLPFLDLTKTSGINQINRASLFCDDPAKVSFVLHLNDKGNEIIGKKVASFILNN